MPTTADAILDAIAAHGIDMVFGIPGTHSLPLYAGLSARGIRHVVFRHEQGAGYAADGYARTSGRTAVCLVTSGPGLTNAITAAATAWADSVPMLVISPGPPHGLAEQDTGFLHELKDQAGMAAHVFEHSERAETPAAAVAAVDVALRALAAPGRRRPRHVEVPLDLLAADAQAPATPRADGLGEHRPLNDATIERAVELIASAERPALVLGGGAVGAVAQAHELSRRLGAPVVTTIGGKGTVPEDDPLSLGASIRLQACHRFLQDDCDLVIAIGSQLAESDLWGPPLSPRAMLRIDADDTQAQKNTPAKVAVIGDAADVLDALLARMPSRSRAPRDVKGLKEQLRREAAVDGGVWRPLVAALRRQLRADTIICGDSTMVVYYGIAHFFEVAQPGLLHYPTGFATLGYALPAAIGAKLAAPGRDVVAVIGDGGLMFVATELLTASELGLGLPVLVPCNGGYGEIRREQREQGIEPTGVDLAEPDWAALAAGLRCNCELTEGPAETASATAAAFERDRPTLIAFPEPAHA